MLFNFFNKKSKEIPLSELLDLQLLKDRIENKLKTDGDYYNFRVGNDKIGQKAYATSPFDPVKEITFTRQDPARSATRDAIYEILIQNKYKKIVKGDHLVTKKDEKKGWYVESSEKKLKKRCEDLSKIDTGYRYGENYFIVHELHPKYDKFSGDFIALFVHTDRL